MNERIKQLRKYLNLSQEAFGSKIRAAQTTIAGYESGARSISDATIHSICREFNVDEIWLRTGEGEMFRIRSQNDDLYAFMGQLLDIDDTDIKVRLVTALSHVGPEGWAALEKFIDDLTEQKKETDS